MNDARGLRTGHLIALAGACLALASLWAPWYRVDITAIREALQQQPAFNGTQLGNFVQSIAALLPRSIRGDGWDTLKRLDVLVAVASSAALAALLAAAGAFGPGIHVARGAAARLSVAVGAICGVFVAGRALNPPGPNAYIETRWGAWACLLGCVLMVVGGISAAGATDEAATLVLGATESRASGGVAGEEQGWGQCASTAPPSATLPGASPRPG